MNIQPEYRALQLGIVMVLLNDSSLKGLELFIVISIYLLAMDGYRWIVRKLKL